ncbi:MAG: YHS domain-containing protein [Ferruginibacter sp.]|nr:YHS domain-containing protein [Ferruginibacter sp.]
MKLKPLSFYLLLFCSLTACNNNNRKEKATSPSKQDTVTTVVTTNVKAEEISFKNLVFEAKTDLVCGMPASAGISDTARYKDKLYGFCSPECKMEFVKDPGGYVKK